MPLRPCWRRYPSIIIPLSRSVAPRGDVVAAQVVQMDNLARSDCRCRGTDWNAVFEHLLLRADGADGDLEAERHAGARGDLVAVGQDDRLTRLDVAHGDGDRVGR